MQALKSILARLVFYAFAAVQGLFIMPLLRLAWPIFAVKVVCVPGNRVGHLAHDPGSVLLKRNAEGRNTWYVISTPPVANTYIRDVYARDMTFIEGKRLNELIQFTVPVMKFWGMYQEPPYTLNVYSTYSSGARTLAFPKELEQEGAAQLARQGIQEHAWLVAFHARERQYFLKHFPDTDLSRHDFRDADITSYLKAAEHIASLGGYALRMGTRDAIPLPTGRHCNVIDYATTFSSQLLDFYICTKSRFILANTSGLYAIGTVAGVPVAAANMVPLFTIPITPKDLFIPKLLKRKGEDRYLTFREIAGMGAGDFYDVRQYEEFGLEVIDNTEDEILDLCIEMLDRLDGVAPPDADRDRQLAFRQFVIQHHPEMRNTGDISYRFLARHPYLLK